MRDAVHPRPAMISFAAPRSESDVLSMFGLASRGQLLALASAVLGGQAPEAIRTLDELAGAERISDGCWATCSTISANLLLYHLGGKDGLLEVSATRNGMPFRLRPPRSMRTP